MDRKEFVQNAGLSLSLVITSQVAIGSNLSPKKLNLPQSKPKIIKDGKGKVLNVIGDIQTHKLLLSDTGNQIVEWVDDVEPGTGIPPHIHTKEDEIFRVVKGEIEIMVDGKTTVLKEGDIAFAPKNIAHAWTVVGTEKAKMITSAFPAGIEAMFSRLAKLPAGPPDFEKVAKICGEHGITFV